MKLSPVSGVNATVNVTYGTHTGDTIFYLYFSNLVFIYIFRLILANNSMFVVISSDICV